MADTVTATDADRRLWSFVLAIVSVATALPVLVVRFLPFTDLPEHVAAMATIARLLPGGGGAPEYTLSLGQSQYLLYHLAGAILTRATGDAILANRLLLFAVAVSFPYAFRSLARVLGRDDRLAIFACMVFWNRALTIGFLPFVASVPLAIFALATLIRQIEAPTRARAGAIAILGIVVFYTHLSSYLLFVFAGGVMTLVRLRTRWRDWMAPLAPLVPSLVAAFVWWRAGSLDAQAGERAHTSRLPLTVVIDAAPIWAFDIWRSHLDELWTSIWWVGFAAILLVALRKPPDGAQVRAGLFAVIPLACAIAVYLLTPFHVGAAGYLDVRLAPLLVLFSLLVLGAAGPTLEGARPRAFALALAALAGLGTAATAAFEMLRVQREMATGLDALLDQMRPHSRVAMLNFEQRSMRTYFWPYVFAGSYHAAKEGALHGYSFAEMSHWSIHYAPSVAPPRHVGLWTYNPCEFRHREDGAYYDYVLVQGPVDPFRDDHPGPQFRPIAHAGVFTLFEKSGDESLDTKAAPDRGICPLRPPPGAYP